MQVLSCGFLLYCNKTFLKYTSIRTTTRAEQRTVTSQQTINLKSNLNLCSTVFFFIQVFIKQSQKIVPHLALELVASVRLVYEVKFPDRPDRSRLLHLAFLSSVPFSWLLPFSIFATKTVDIKTCNFSWNTNLPPLCLNSRPQSFKRCLTLCTE